MKKPLFVSACLVEGISLTHVFTFSAFVYAFWNLVFELRGFWEGVFLLALFQGTFDATRSIRNAWIDTLNRSIEVQNLSQKLNYKLLSIVCALCPLALIVLLLRQKLHILQFNLLWWPVLFASIASLKVIDESLRIRAPPDAQNK